jgi:hypothetical protein
MLGNYFYLNFFMQRSVAQAELLNNMWDAATTHLDSALTVAESAEPISYADLLDLLRMKAAICMTRHELGAAEVILRKGLQIAETKCPRGANHLEILGRLGWVMSCKDLMSARTYLEAAHELYHKDIPNDLWLSIQWSLALVYFRLRFWQGCVTCGESLLNLIEQFKSYINPNFAADIFNLFNRIPLQVEGILKLRRRILELQTELR